jgi:hypothetical protein
LIVTTDLCSNRGVHFSSFDNANTLALIDIIMQIHPHRDRLLSATRFLFAAQLLLLLTCFLELPAVAQSPASSTTELNARPVGDGPQRDNQLTAFAGEVGELENHFRRSKTSFIPLNRVSPTSKPRNTPSIQAPNPKRAEPVMLKKPDRAW